MLKSTLVALCATAAFAAIAQPKPDARISILKQTENVAKSCDGDMPFRAGVAIPSNDPKRPGMMAIAVGNVNCIADPVPAQETAGHLAYLTAQLAPAHVIDQLQRTGTAKSDFAFTYKGTQFEMQQLARRVDTGMITNNTMLCHDYNFVSKTAAGKFIASGEVQVCLPEHRLLANNLPVVPLEGASQGPAPARRGYTEPRDKQYYGS